MCTLKMLDHDELGRDQALPDRRQRADLHARRRAHRRLPRPGLTSHHGRIAAPSLGTYLLLAYLPPEHAVEGKELRVMYMNELYPVEVARVGSQPLFDPDDTPHEVMRILVCVKRVPAPGARINITADGQAVDTAFLGFTTSPHEECAVEAAAQLVEAHGGTATVMTLGPAEAEEQLRYAASVGMTHAVLLPIDGADWDPQRTAGP